MPPKDARESPLRLLKRFVFRAGPWEKQSLGHAVYWVKLLLSLLVGIVVAFLRLPGMISHIVFALACHLLVHLYVASVLEVEIETVMGGAGAVITEGLLQCYAMFILTWTGLNTLFHDWRK
jgi:asparagine N-glycosylation enzyme membrane subunit Stt3